MRRSVSIIMSVFVAQGAVAQAPPATPAAAAPALSLDAYLDQVRSGNNNFVSAEKTKGAAELRKNEWKLSTTPSLFATAQYMEDKKESGSTLQGDKLNQTLYTLGVRTQTSFGLEGSLKYNYVNTALPDATATLPGGIKLMDTQYITTGPVLELSQSLWRNGSGREVRAAQEASKAEIKAQEFNSSFQQKQILVEAESVYWRLALARESVATTKASFERATRLRDWNAQREKYELADRADLLQADAALLSRSLELQTAQDEEKSAARAFNTLRGVATESVTEVVTVLDPTMIEKLAVPQRTGQREDLKAAEQRKQALEASAKLGEERNKPNVAVYGSVGLNGRDPDFDPALKEASSTGHATYVVGVKLDMPLDFGNNSRSRQGYRAQAQAADLSYQRQAFEQERLWMQLTNQFQEAVNRLQLSRKIEKLQEEKLEYERGRQKRGRTTTFQVISFEQEFANAQMARIKMQADVLNLYAQLKTFGGAQ